MPVVYKIQQNEYLNYVTTDFSAMFAFKATVSRKVLTWTKIPKYELPECKASTNILFKTQNLTRTVVPDKEVQFPLVGHPDDEYVVNLVEEEFLDPTVGTDWFFNFTGPPPESKPFFGMKLDLDGFHLAVGIPFIAQVLVTVDSQEKYSFGVDTDVYFKVEASEGVTLLEQNFNHFVLPDTTLDMVLNIFGLLKIPAKGLWLKVSIHPDYGVVGDGNLMRLFYRYALSSISSTVASELNIEQLYSSDDFKSRLQSVRLLKRP